MKRLSRKHWIIISVCLISISGITLAAKFNPKSKENEEMKLREYPVTRGDINAGICCDVHNR